MKASWLCPVLLGAGTAASAMGSIDDILVICTQILHRDCLDIRANTTKPSHIINNSNTHHNHHRHQQSTRPCTKQLENPQSLPSTSRRSATKPSRTPSPTVTRTWTRTRTRLPRFRYPSTASPDPKRTLPQAVHLGSRRSKLRLFPLHPQAHYPTRSMMTPKSSTPTPTPAVRGQTGTLRRRTGPSRA